MNGPAQIRDGGGLLPGSYRLDSSKYQAVFAAKKSFYGPTLVIWIAIAPDAGRRAGVVVSKRTFRRAVDRNRAKRLMREAFRLSRHRLKPDVDMILIARGGIAGKRCQDVMVDFERVCRRAKVWQTAAAPGGAPV
jgi:ribonuclease P protein component